MRDVDFGLNNKVSLKKLEVNRDIYKGVEWLGSGNIRTKIWEMRDNHLLNVMKTVSQNIETSKLYPLVESFKSYNEVSYNNWAQFLYNEFLFREKALEKEYREYQELEIQRQSRYDNDYYNDELFVELGDPYSFYK